MTRITDAELRERLAPDAVAPEDPDWDDVVARMAGQLESELRRLALERSALGAKLAPGPDMTTDSLQLFLKDIGKVRLLTAQEEVDLAKRIERGDLDAKQ
ncbi:MAG: sigma-70 factor domain-containing protein, partial [Thermoleophilaceae bacterium]